VSFGQHLRRVTGQVARLLGGGATVTLRRRHSLISLKSVPSTLLLAGAHAEGATAVSLRATNLSGSIVPGLRLTIGGTQYEVGGSAEVRAVSNTLGAVPITTPLAVAAADGATVTVEPFRDYSVPVVYVQRREELADGTLVRGGGQDLIVPYDGASIAPRSDDAIVIGGIPGETVSVDPIQPGNVVAGWRLRRAGRAA
jgi:hypothetical protein